MSTDITTPTGRIVWGHPTNGRPKIDDKTKQPVMKDGVAVTQWSFGLAIPKAEFAPIWAVMQTEAMKHFPAGVFPADYAWKYVDGDGMDKGNPLKGIPPQPYSKREGYAGCYVIAISTEFQAPTVFKWVGTWQQVDPLNIDGNGNKLKTGDYVQVGLNIDAHLGQSPGLYMNPRGIQFVGFGQAIISGPDAATMFGAGPAALPPGATAAPAAPVGVPGAPMPGMPATPLPGGLPGMPGGMPQAPTAPVAAPVAAIPAAPQVAPALPTASPSSLPGMPGAPIPPATGFVAAAAGLPGMPAAPTAAPAPAPAPAPGPAVPAGFPAGSTHTGFDPASGKAIWQWPDGNRYLAP